MSEFHIPFIVRFGDEIFIRVYPLLAAVLAVLTASTAETIEGTFSTLGR